MEQAPPAWRIGLDEAGYGPNLGPLAIGATAWRVESDDAAYDRRLADAVTDNPRARDGRVLIADSKAVYQPGGGLAKLETAVLGALADRDDPPETWRALVERLGADPTSQHDRQPWRRGFDLPLPIDAADEQIAGAAARFAGLGGVSGGGTTRLAARLVFPEEFNELVDEHGTKGAALSHATLELARRVVDSLGIDPAADGPPVAITFDKHGGRNRYAELVEHWFPAAPVSVVEESRPVSRYTLGPRVTLTFRSKGEAETPVALASMTAKLLREIAMRSLNAFWTRHVPGLKPTAGYPVDAKRFKSQIAPKQAELSIEDHTLWRNR